MITQKSNAVKVQSYVLLEEIGRGAFGVVYKGYHQATPTELVAIKIIEDMGNLDRLLVEPELMSKLYHPNIVQIKDFFLHAGKLILVTEFLDGKSLEQYIEEKGLFSPTQVKDFLIQMASALTHAHAKRIIHRDIKINNIIVIGEAPDLRYVLVDFGISRMAKGIQTVKSTGGTFAFMAPEQLRGRPSSQSDLWALGVCAYIMLTGKKPFDGSTRDELLQQITFSNPMLPSQINTNTNFHLENIVLKLLEKQLSRRYASADDLIQAIQGEIPKDLETVTDSEINVNPKFSFQLKWDEEIQKKIRSNKKRFLIYAALSVLPISFASGMFSEGVFIAIWGALAGILAVITYYAAFLFFQGQEKKVLGKTVGAIVIMLLTTVASFILLMPFYESLGYDADSLLRLLDLVSLIFIAAAYNNFLEIRNLEKSKFVMNVLRGDFSGDEDLFKALKSFLLINWEDINLHLKYIELLIFRNRYQEAVTEARILLITDPYNFGGNILLAHSYFELGLYEDCTSVCNNYLSISGYSFEFADLKKKCEKIIQNEV